MKTLIEKMLIAPLGRPDSVKGTDVFGPWTNHWSGTWSTEERGAHRGHYYTERPA